MKDEELRNGLSAEWAEKEDGTRTALVVKRNGVVIVEVAAVSDAFFVKTKGSDEKMDLMIGYYGDAGSDAPVPEMVTRVIYDDSGNPSKVVGFDAEGKIEAVDEIPGAVPSDL